VTSLLAPGLGGRGSANRKLLCLQPVAVTVCTCRSQNCYCQHATCSFGNVLYVDVSIVEVPAVAHQILPFSAGT
jgi:hypothetical protein